MTSKTHIQRPLYSAVPWITKKANPGISGHWRLCAFPYIGVRCCCVRFAIDGRNHARSQVTKCHLMLIYSLRQRPLIKEEVKGVGKKRMAEGVDESEGESAGHLLFDCVKKSARVTVYSWGVGEPVFPKLELGSLLSLVNVLSTKFQEREAQLLDWGATSVSDEAAISHSLQITKSPLV